MFIVTRIWISISDLDLNSIIESHNENLKNLVNFIIIIKMANGMGSFAFFGFISRPWHFWAHINYHCDPFDTRTPNFYFLGWFSNLFFWPKKRCAFWLRIMNLWVPRITHTGLSYDKALLPEARVTGLILNRDVEHFHSLRLTGRQGARCARIAL